METDDLLQECIVVLWRRRDEVALDKARSFLFGAARNVLLAYHRKHEKCVPLCEWPADPGKTAVPGPDTALESAELTEKLNNLVKLLSPRQQDLVRLVHFEGMSYAVAGRHLIIPAERARTQYHIAMKKLREHVAGVSDLE